VHHRVDLGIPSDVATAARALVIELDRRDQRAEGYRTPAVAKRLAAEGRWRDVPFQPEAEAGRVDPRTLTIALDDLLPAERTVVNRFRKFHGISGHVPRGSRRARLRLHPRRFSPSGLAWPPRSAPPSPAPTASRSRPSVTAAR